MTDTLKKKGYDVVVEPHLKTSLGTVHVPDLVITRGESSAIIDAQVTGTGMDLELCHKRKVLDYSSPGILQQVQKHRKEEPVVTTITMNLRGIWGVQAIYFNLGSPRTT